MFVTCFLFPLLHFSACISGFSIAFVFKWLCFLLITYLFVLRVFSVTRFSDYATQTKCYVLLPTNQFHILIVLVALCLVHLCLYYMSNLVSADT